VGFWARAIFRIFLQEKWKDGGEFLWTGLWASFYFWDGL